MSMIGKTLGSFECTGLLGKGGMGEVYRAKDQKLGRDVAIKVLPEEFAKDTDRVARFQREAKLLASLNHPNIAAIHGLEESDGTHFLVLELIEGDTLADRIKGGPIPVEKSLKFALQIAEALEAAHEKGVIHRDLKPANIKVTPDGKAKVLDFGLAKAFAGESADMNLSNSPTLSVAATQQGVILGTAAYMSPEQARGKPVDKRTDIWAFGVVLYEMLTGKSAFQGEDVSVTLASVIKGDANLNLLPPSIHPRVREAITRCLQNDIGRRYSSIADARYEIEQALSDPSGLFVQPITAAKSREKMRVGIPWLAATTVLSLIVAGIAVWILKPTESRPVMRFNYDLPENQRFSNTGRHAVAVSADGLKIVYVANHRLYLKDSNEWTARPIQGTDEDSANPFFSPDGNWIGYFDLSNDELKKIPAMGGSPVMLCKVTEPVGATWRKDDTIVYGEINEGIMRISANGGNPEVIVKAESDQPFCPQILPDGKSILFTVVNDNEFQVVVQSLESGERKELFPGGPAQYLTTGHLVYGVGHNLYAVLFDLDSLEPMGGPFPIVEGVFREALNRQTQLAISESGTLVYIPSSTSYGSQFEWYDRQGHAIESLGETANYIQFSLSPHENRIVTQHDGDLWVLDLDRAGGERRITFNPAAEGDPIWSPDGNSIVFSGPGGLYRKHLIGEQDPELLVESKESRLYSEDWSDDGRFIAYLDDTNPEEQRICVLPLSDGQAPETVIAGNFNYDEPEFSPNGKWMAYISDEAGGNPEVYIRPFQSEGETKRISTGGGGQPQWKGDGKELFYLAPDGSMMAVDIDMKESSISIGSQTKLFQTGFIVDPVRDQYAVTRDGQRFLMFSYSQANRASSLNIVLNWFKELKERVPTE